MAKFEVTPEMMVSISKEIDQKIEEWNTAVNTIYTLHKELDAMWEGEANNKLNLKMQEDMPKYQALASLMTEYSGAIAAAAAQYASADTEAANIINAIR